MRSASHLVKYNDPDAIKLLQLSLKQIARLVVIEMDVVIDFTSLFNLRSLTFKYMRETQFKSIRSQYFSLLEILYIYVCQLQKKIFYGEITVDVILFFPGSETLLP